MSVNIYPCVWHQQTAHEAAQFYVDTLPECEILESNPLAVKIAVFGFPILLLNGGTAFTPNPSISFFTYCTTISDAKERFDKLKENGKILMKFDRYPWADAYGCVQDKYHATWQLFWDKSIPLGKLLKPGLMFTNQMHGKAQDAIEFYRAIFPQQELIRIKPYNEDSDNVGKVMLAELDLYGNRILLMDGGANQAFTFNEGISLVLECNDQAEIDYYWDHFTKEGTPNMCGWCKDKFGISWQVIPKNFTSYIQTPESVQRMLKMKKIVIADF